MSEINKVNTENMGWKGNAMLPMIHLYESYCLKDSKSEVKGTSSFVTKRFYYIFFTLKLSLCIIENLYVALVDNHFK